MQGGAFDAGARTLEVRRPLFVMNYAAPPRGTAGNAKLTTMGARPLRAGRGGSSALATVMYALESEALAEARIMAVFRPDMPTATDRPLKHCRVGLKRHMQQIGQGLCALRKVNFNAFPGVTPGYTNNAQTSLCLLRYSAACIVEYRVAFAEALASGHLQPGDLRVLSPGCGAFLDKPGAYCALHDSPARRGARLDDVGVDRADRGRDALPEALSRFIHKAVGDVEEADLPGPVDILCLPRSFPEIAGEDLERFLSRFSARAFADRGRVICSSRGGQEDDETAQRLFNSLSRNFGLVSSQPPSNVTALINGFPVELGQVFEPFTIPPNVISTVNDIEAACCRRNGPDCETCQSTINRWPVTKTGSFHTTIHLLHKAAR